jgi:hypothetical protein
MICSLNILFNHPVSEATPNSKSTGTYCTLCLADQFDLKSNEHCTFKQCIDDNMHLCNSFSIILFFPASMPLTMFVCNPM